MSATKLTFSGLASQVTVGDVTFDVVATDAAGTPTAVTSDLVFAVSCQDPDLVIVGPLWTIPSGQHTVSVTVSLRGSATSQYLLQAVRSTGPLISSASQFIELEAGSPSALVLEIIPDQRQNVPFIVTVHSVDIAGNDAPTLSDKLITIVKSSGDGLLTGALSKTLSTGSASVQVGPMRLNVVTADNSVVLRASATGYSDGTSNPFDVVEPFVEQAIYPCVFQDSLKGTYIDASGKQLLWFPSKDILNVNLPRSLGGPIAVKVVDRNYLLPGVVNTMEVMLVDTGGREVTALVDWPIAQFVLFQDGQTNRLISPLSSPATITAGTSRTTVQFTAPNYPVSSTVFLLGFRANMPYDGLYPSQVTFVSTPPTGGTTTVDPLANNQYRIETVPQMLIKGQAVSISVARLNQFGEPTVSTQFATPFTLRLLNSSNQLISQGTGTIQIGQSTATALLVTPAQTSAVEGKLRVVSFAPYAYAEDETALIPIEAADTNKRTFQISSPPRAIRYGEQFAVTVTLPGSLTAGRITLKSDDNSSALQGEASKLIEGTVILFDGLSWDRVQNNARIRATYEPNDGDVLPAMTATFDVLERKSTDPPLDLDGGVDALVARPHVKADGSISFYRIAAAGVCRTISFPGTFYQYNTSSGMATLINTGGFRDTYDIEIMNVNTGEVTDRVTVKYAGTQVRYCNPNPFGPWYVQSNNASQRAAAFWFGVSSNGVKYWYAIGAQINFVPNSQNWTGPYWNTWLTIDSAIPPLLPSPRNMAGGWLDSEGWPNSFVSDPLFGSISYGDWGVPDFIEGLFHDPNFARAIPDSLHKSALLRYGYGGGYVLDQLGCELVSPFANGRKTIRVTISGLSTLEFDAAYPNNPTYHYVADLSVLNGTRDLRYMPLALHSTNRDKRINKGLRYREYTGKNGFPAIPVTQNGTPTTWSGRLELACNYPNWTLKLAMPIEFGFGYATSSQSGGVAPFNGRADVWDPTTGSYGSLAGAQVSFAWPS